MKASKALLIYAFLLSTFSMFASSYANINFIENNLEIAKHQAAQEGKLIMVDFWANWCSPCKWMDEQTFNSPEVAKYLNNTYVSVRVNIDNLDGLEYKRQYGIRYLPTILVLDANGKVLKKYEESMAPSKLLKVLRAQEERYLNDNTSDYYSIQSPTITREKPIKSAPKISYRPSTTGKSRDIVTNSRRQRSNTSIKEDYATSTHSTPTNTYSTDTNNYSSNEPTNSYASETRSYDEPANDYAADSYSKENTGRKIYNPTSMDGVSEIGLYQLNVIKAPKTGFSVQVGAYYDYKNVLTEVARFQNIFAEEVLVHISEFKGTTCYKVMLGHYPSHTAATKDKVILKEAGVKDAFVKDLSTF